ncbi:MAG: translesion error-prone DNA polymerase V autoproteolytic subunit [bacterium]
MTDPNNNRSLVILNDYVCAGFPSPADDYAETGIDLNELLVSHPASTFFIRVKGESMVGARIQDGDVIMVDRSLEPIDGNVILALLNGEFIVKRYKKKGSNIQLIPEYETPHSTQCGGAITVAREDNFEVWGVVSYIIHKSK